MKLKLLLTFLLLLFLSCSHNKNNFSPINEAGKIIINPYGSTPLSAVYRTSSVNTLPITVIVKGQYGEPDIIHTYPAGYGTEFEIHGMFPETLNTIIVNDGTKIIEKNEFISPLNYLGVQISKKFNVEINNLENEKYDSNPDLYFIMYTTLLGISRNGYVRYCLYNYENISEKIVVENNKLMIYRTYDICNLLGKSYIKDMDAHHDHVKKGNNYLYLSHSKWGNEDAITEIDSYGNIVRELNFGTLIKNIVLPNNNNAEIEILNKIVFDENNIHINSSGQKVMSDWFHANSLVYDSSTDILYVSSRNRGVLAIDYSEWKLIWWMADKDLNTVVDIDKTSINSSGIIPFKYLSSLEPYRVKGDGINNGPKNQHALFLLANGNIAMFDNQGDEELNPAGSRYIEYNITKFGNTYNASAVYEYRDPNYYSRIVSDVDYTGDNYKNILICYGMISTILEIEKTTKKELFKLATDKSFPVIYRADKMPLYYDLGRVYSEDANLKNRN